MPTILYLWLVPSNPVQERKLAGIRRCASARRWDVVPLAEPEDGKPDFRAILAKWRPAGCIIECAGGRNRLQAGAFGRIPVVYLDRPQEASPRNARRLGVSMDDDAVARAAFQELSSGRPSSFAAVEWREPVQWARRRVQVFRSLAAEAEAPCEVFAARRGEAVGLRSSRLEHWLAGLPRPCGVFAVNDETGVEVVRACQATRLAMPREITLVGVDNSARYCEAGDTPFTSIQIDFERMGYLAAKMLGEASRTTREDNPVAVGPLLAVRRKSTGGRGRHEPRILEAVETIRREACNGLTARRLLSRFPGSRRLLEMRFREATGHSILDEILHVRLEQVLTMLAQTDTAIEAIPGLCGFCGNRALERLFRRRFGMSMLEWRKRSR